MTTQKTFFTKPALKTSTIMNSNNMHKYSITPIKAGIPWIVPLLYDIYHSAEEDRISVPIAQLPGFSKDVLGQPEAEQTFIIEPYESGFASLQRNLYSRKLRPAEVRDDEVVFIGQPG